MRKCSNCGKQNDDGYLYCAYCGTRLIHGKNSPEPILGKDSTRENIYDFMKSELQREVLSIVDQTTKNSIMIDSSYDRIKGVNVTEEIFDAWESYMKLQHSINDMIQFSSILTMFHKIIMKTLMYEIPFTQFKMALLDITNEHVLKYAELSSSSQRGCFAALSMLEVSLIGVFLEIIQE